MKEMEKLEDIGLDFPYYDILYLEYPTSKIYPRQPMSVRAGQFSPFTALTGFDEMVLEEERVTQDKVFLDTDRLDSLDEKLKRIENNLDKYFVVVTYFVKDLYKEGGMYLERRGTILKIDRNKKELVFTDKGRIKMKDIVNIEIIDKK